MGLQKKMTSRTTTFLGDIEFQVNGQIKKGSDFITTEDASTIITQKIKEINPSGNTPSLEGYPTTDEVNTALEAIQQNLDKKADIEDLYTKEEADAKYALKSEIPEIPDDYATVDILDQYALKTYSYSKSEADSRFFLQTEFPDDYITNTDLAEFAKTVDHYTKTESDKKYREKNDLIYEETEDIPFAHRRDENDIFEVKILMTRLTRLVGTICGRDGVVKNFEILFDFDVNHQTGSDIEWGVEIDGQNYYAAYTKVADDDWRFFISNDLENFDTVLHKAEKILKKDDIPLKADLYTKTESDNKYREKNDLIYEETEDVPFEHRRSANDNIEVKIKMGRFTRLVGTMRGNDGFVKNFNIIWPFTPNYETEDDIEWGVEIDGQNYYAAYTKILEDDWRFFIFNDKETFHTELQKAEKLLIQDEFALKADHYTKTESDNKYREKKDLIYKDAVNVPFENILDSGGRWEVKIKMTRGTHLVGTICEEDGVIHNFDFIFDYDEGVPENSEIYIDVDIDGKNYYVNYVDNAPDDWRFFIESESGNLDTKLTLAEKILKKDEFVLKTDNNFELEKFFETAMTEFIRTDRNKDALDSPSQYLGYFYWPDNDFELGFKFDLTKREDKYLILQYQMSFKWDFVLFLNIATKSGTLIVFSKLGDFQYRIVKNLVLKTELDTDKYRREVSKVCCTFERPPGFDLVSDDYLEDLGDFSDVKYFKVVRSNNDCPVGEIFGYFINFFLSFNNKIKDDTEWKIFYPGFVECYDQNVANSITFMHPSKEGRILVIFEYSDIYEVVILFYDLTGKRHFIRILHHSQIALLDEIYGGKAVQIAKFDADAYEYSFPIASKLWLAEDPENHLYIKQVKLNE